MITERQRAAWLLPDGSLCPSNEDDWSLFFSNVIRCEICGKLFIQDNLSGHKIYQDDEWDDPAGQLEGGPWAALPWWGWTMLIVTLPLTIPLVAIFSAGSALAVLLVKIVAPLTDLKNGGNNEETQQKR